MLVFIFLVPCLGCIPWYGNVWFTFSVPRWAIPLEHWQSLVYFLALCVCIVHAIYIYIYKYTYLLVDGCALCMMDSQG